MTFSNIEEEASVGRRWPFQKSSTLNAKAKRTNEPPSEHANEQTNLSDRSINRPTDRGVREGGGDSLEQHRERERARRRTERWDGLLLVQCAMSPLMEGKVARFKALLFRHLPKDADDFHFSHFALPEQPARTDSLWRRYRRSWQARTPFAGGDRCEGRFRALVLQKLHISHRNSQREQSCTFCLLKPIYRAGYLRK